MLSCIPEPIGPAFALSVSGALSASRGLTEGNGRSERKRASGYQLVRDIPLTYLHEPFLFRNIRNSKTDKVIPTDPSFSFLVPLVAETIESAKARRSRIGSIETIRIPAAEDGTPFIYT